MKVKKHKESSDSMYGLLGKKLGHSFSKIIHEQFTSNKYELIEKDELESFFKRKDFNGINVTIPYKHDVITYLDELSPEAQEIGAVNTITNIGGKLKGYNTDYYGLEKALNYNDISVYNNDIIILGNGSTSRTIKVYCNNNFAKNIYILARNPNENEYHFNDVDKFKSVSIVFNATPVGMFPNNNQDTLIDLNTLPNLTSVIDVVYNPLYSNLLIEAKLAGKKTVNGLMMLVLQAVKSIELFHNVAIQEKDVMKYYKELLFAQSNLAFIGMPMSGKSFIGKLCADKYNKTFIDLDKSIEKTKEMTIPEIFDSYGEKAFRRYETNEVEKYSKQHSYAISCGGGVILNQNNMKMLRQNSVIIFIDFPLTELKKCNPKDRPLLKNNNMLDKLFKERYNIYKENADIIINKSDFDEKSTLSKIEVKLNEYFRT